MFDLGARSCRSDGDLSQRLSSEHTAVLREAPSRSDALQTPSRMVSTSDAHPAPVAVSTLSESGSPHQKACVFKHSEAQGGAALCERNVTGGVDGCEQNTSHQPSTGWRQQTDGADELNAVTRQRSPTEPNAEPTADDLIADLRKGKNVKPRMQLAGQPPLSGNSESVQSISRLSAS